MPFSLRSLSHRVFAAPLFALLALAMSPAGVEAQLTSCGAGQMDASQTTSSGWGVDAYTNAGVERGVGQVFVAQTTGVLAEVSVLIRDMAGAPNITPRLDIYSATAPGNVNFNRWLPVGSYTGPLAATGTPQVYTFNLSGITVKAGRAYALVVTGAGATPTNALRVYGQALGNAYTPGRSFTTSNPVPGVPKSGLISRTLLSAPRDLAFQTCVVPVTTGPVPGCGGTGRVWVDRSPPNPCAQSPSVYPEPRLWHDMAYDRSWQVTVMFGGQQTNFGQVLGDTWYWDGSSWQQDLSPNQPPARVEHAMAWDPVSGKVLLYGGANLNTIYDDLWVWNGPGLGWTQLGSALPPGKRYGFAMATDESRDMVVLTAGRSPNGSVFSDTWEWSGFAWTPGGGSMPTPRAYHAMAYHPMYGLGGGMLNFGGWNQSLTYLANPVCWLPTWKQVVNSPANRYNPTMAYDPPAEKIVMYGGTTQSVYFDDTWLWDSQTVPNGTWTQVSPSPNPGKRAYHAMAYDEARDEIVVFGGIKLGQQCQGTNWSNETWVAARCYTDWDGDWVGGTPNDIAAFQAALLAGNQCTDCNGDGQLDQFDVLCFQNMPCP